MHGLQCQPSVLSCNLTTLFMEKSLEADVVMFQWQKPVTQGNAASKTERTLTGHTHRFVRRLCRTQQHTSEKRARDTDRSGFQCWLSPYTNLPILQSLFCLSFLYLQGRDNKKKNCLFLRLWELKDIMYRMYIVSKSQYSLNILLSLVCEAELVFMGENQK